MITADQRVIELAIQALETQQERIQQELTDLRRRLSSTRPTLKVTRQGSARPAPNKGKTMSAAQKKKIAKAMKARWAKIRGGKAA